MTGGAAILGLCGAGLPSRLVARRTVGVWTFCDFRVSRTSCVTGECLLPRGRSERKEPGNLGHAVTGALLASLFAFLISCPSPLSMSSLVMLAKRTALVSPSSSPQLGQLQSALSWFPCNPPMSSCLCLWTCCLATCLRPRFRLRVEAEAKAAGQDEDQGSGQRPHAPCGPSLQCNVGCAPLTKAAWAIASLRNRAAP